MSWRSTQEFTLVVSGVPAATQYLTFDCEDGRPSAVGTPQAWASDADDTSTAESCFSGSATVETNPNTTITAVAGPSNASNDPTAIALTSATGVVIGRRYLLTEDGTGVSEFFEVASVSGLNVKARHPLINDYSAGSTVQSTRVSIAMDATWLADVSNLSPTFSPNPSYRVRWPVTVNGNETTYATAFDVVRYPVNHGVTPIDVDNAHRGWLDRLPPDHRVNQGRSIIEAAYQSLKHELYADGRADQAVRNPELIARLVIQRCPLELLHDNVMRGNGDPVALELATNLWRQTYDQAFRAPIAPVDMTGDGGAQVTRPLPLTVR